ncbi:DoxX family protein [Flavobacterium sp.]
MNYLLITCVLFSSISFAGYAISYFILPNMKNEFERFDLKNLGIFVIILEIIGAVGLLVGLFYNPLLLLASGGLALLMFLGLLTRIKVNDSLLVSLPATFYMLLNAYIFYLGFMQ